MAAPSHPKGKATRAQVAARAGVSQTTVAYVFNPKPGVQLRPETIQRVLEAARELAYVPSFSARSMKRGRTDLIGILIPGQHSQFHPYYSQMLHGICEAAAASDYHFLYLTQDRVEKYLSCLSRRYVDGVIMIQSEAGEEHLARLLEFQLPVVTLNLVHARPVPQVTMDYEGAMLAALAGMVQAGARKLLFVHGPWDNQPLERYRQAGRDFCATQGSPVEFSVERLARYAADPELVKLLEKKRIDGLLVDGDELAQDICQQLRSPAEQKLALAVFSEARQPPPLPPEVEIYRAQPQLTGRLCWEEMVRSLAEKEKAGARVIRVPFLHLPGRVG